MHTLVILLFSSVNIVGYFLVCEYYHCSCRALDCDAITVRKNDLLNELKHKLFQVHGTTNYNNNKLKI